MASPHPGCALPSLCPAPGTGNLLGHPAAAEGFSGTQGPARAGRAAAAQLPYLGSKREFSPNSQLGDIDEVTQKGRTGAAQEEFSPHKALITMAGTTARDTADFPPALPCCLAELAPSREIWRDYGGARGVKRVKLLPGALQPTLPREGGEAAAAEETDECRVGSAHVRRGDRREPGVPQTG